MYSLTHSLTHLVDTYIFAIELFLSRAAHRHDAVGQPAVILREVVVVVVGGDGDGGGDSRRGGDGGGDVGFVACTVVAMSPMRSSMTYTRLATPYVTTTVTTP